ncbi:MAG: hypothetical protein QOF30_1783, partial [Acidimicrobiaceae bacterium]|nr:hypothetical protein [Acidimicrobiaceae bacterium]
MSWRIVCKVHVGGHGWRTSSLSVNRALRIVLCRESERAFE